MDWPWDNSHLRLGLTWESSRLKLGLILGKLTLEAWTDPETAHTWGLDWSWESSQLRHGLTLRLLTFEAWTDATKACASGLGGMCFFFLRYFLLSLQTKVYNPCFTMRYTTGYLQYWYVWCCSLNLEVSAPGLSLGQSCPQGRMDTVPHQI
jgi:hypothetical protein